MMKILLLLCCFGLSLQTGSIKELTDITEEDYRFNLVIEKILSTQERMSNFALRHPELNLETQEMWTGLEPYKGNEKLETVYNSNHKPNTNFSAIKYSSEYNQCREDLIHVATSLTSQWVFRMLDSFGKPPSGILFDGQVKWVGNYDECLNVTAPLSSRSQQGFRGRYAWMSFNVSSLQTSPITKLLGALKIGACLPSSCAVGNEFNDLNQKLIALLERIPFIRKLVKKLPIVDVTFIPETKPLDSASKACISILAILLLFVIIGTLLDALKSKKLIGQPSSLQSPPPSQVSDGGETSTEKINKGSSISSPEHIEEIDDKVKIIIEAQDACGSHSLLHKLLEFFLCFSATSNGMALLNTTTGQGQLQCVHGIRFLSMAWVILGHTYYFGSGSFTNMKDALDVFQTWPFQVIVQGTLSVDTFFLLSGCLLTYLFLKTENQLKSFTQWISFYVHRYVRLTPAYALMLFVFGTWWNNLSNGPLWTVANRNICAKAWWKNLLYINNLFPATQMCMAWSWYLANDMQFFIISPLFLIAFRRNRKLGLGVVGLLLFASWLTTGILSRVREWGVIFQNLGESDTSTFGAGQLKMFDEIYDKPYTRIGPYLIGVLLGYILIETDGQKSFMNKGLVILGWVGSQSLSLIIIYGMLNANIGLITASAHNTLARSAWGLSLAWVIFACLTGHGGPVDTILSWKMFLPLSRLTYCAYLVHPMVIMWYYNSMKATIFFSNSTIVINYLAFLVLSYGMAFLASLLFEAPIIKLEKLLRKKKS